jgi:uncharacterized protein (TIGR03000 family)
MLRNWTCTAAIVGVTALMLLTPDTSFAQRGGGGHGGRAGWGGGWGVGMGVGGAGYGYGGYYAPGYGYGGYYGDGYGSPYNPSYMSTGTYAAAATTSYNAFYYNQGSTSDASYGQQKNMARVTVKVPSPDAKVEFGDKWTKQTGTTRLFVSPPLEAGYTYTYHITARWTDNGGREIERERNVKVQPGQQVSVDFSQPLQQPETSGKLNQNRHGEPILQNRDRIYPIDRDRQTQKDRDRKTEQQPPQDR